MIVINDDVVFGMNGLLVRLTVLVVMGREVVVNLFTTGVESIGTVLIVVVVGTVSLVMIGLFIMVVAYFGTSGASGIVGTVIGSFAEVVTVIILDCVVGTIVVLSGTGFVRFGMVVVGFTYVVRIGVVVLMREVVVRARVGVEDKLVDKLGGLASGGITT